MKHLQLPQALTLGLISLCLAAPLGASAKTKTPEPLQCERDGRMQDCEDASADAAKPQKAKAFKAQATDMTGETVKPVKKSKKKGKKAAKKKAKRSVAE